MTLSSAYRTVATTALLMLLSACGGSQDSGVAREAVARIPADPEQALLVRLYRDQRLPEDFYPAFVAGAAQDDAFYSVAHVRNIDTVPLAARNTMTASELATNDFSQALAWSEAAESYQPVYRDLVDSRETAAYFEFLRVDMQHPEVTHYSRVLKQAFLDRSMTDQARLQDWQATVTFGRLGVIDAAHLRDAVEYLWWFGPGNNFGYAITAQSASETPSAVIFDLEVAQLEMNFNGGCDTVRRFTLRYSADRQTGVVTRSYLPGNSLQARLVDGRPEICQN